MIYTFGGKACDPKPGTSDSKFRNLHFHQKTPNKPKNSDLFACSFGERTIIGIPALKGLSHTPQPHTSRGRKAPKQQEKHEPTMNQSAK